MVSRPPRIIDVSRSASAVPAAVCAASLLLALALTGCTGASGASGAPGGSGLRDPYFPKAGNGGYDVTHYELRLRYDPGRNRLTGKAALTARATRDLSAFDLDLKGLDVERVGVEGRRARWNRTGQELTVRPHGSLDKGETFRVTVRYSGTPKAITDPDGSQEGWLRTRDGALALGEPLGSMTWFPGNHHPSDKASYDIAVTVPEGLQAVSNGELTGQATSRGRTTFTWHTAEPMASYVATVAVGRYDIRRTSTGDGLPVYVAVDPARAEESRAVLAKIPEVMEWAENNFGPYPFSSTGAIVDDADGIGYALETQNRPVFPGTPDTETLVHELAHQWYGDSVTPKTWRDMWLNEGFATYAEWLWQEDHGGDTTDEIFKALYRGDYYDDPEENRAIWAFPPARPDKAAHLSDSPVYDRGAMVLHKIRQKVGDDTFYDIVQGWAAAHRHGNADTAEFTAYVEKKAPDKNFGRIWKDWLYGNGKPDRP
ncbi:M1 family metallopeptidase [Streptomyces luteolifulvus]|uniref:Aminopeptidase N n=1 Tax=Streptomyces luteolifulvus TaxID=2615112 RepID=A0A6H9V3W6_9ACTN|nr:M1 family metallopeptidase [Streptomyces luteolifulvus]